MPMMVTAVAKSAITRFHCRLGREVPGDLEATAAGADYLVPRVQCAVSARELTSLASPNMAALKRTAPFV